MICSKCKLDLPEKIFGIDRRAARGRTYACKGCRSAQHASWRVKNRPYMADYMASWRDENKEHFDAYMQRWRDSHRAQRAAREAGRRSLLKTPPWADIDCINSLYELARIATEATGEEWQVDHIVPIRGRLVCGLHVETNLQLLTAKANASKGNRFAVEEI